MNRSVNACAACLVLWLSTSALADGLFEDQLAVEVEKGLRGPRGMPGDVLQLKDGTLLMSYTQDPGIMGIRSQDQGKTWDEPFVLIPSPKPPAKGRYAHPSFLRLPDGHVLLSYIYTTHPTTPYYGHNYYRRSADECKTWTEQFILSPHPGYHLVHNDRLFILSSGRIVAMAEYKAHMPSTRDHSGYVGMAFYSDDSGYSWQVSKNTVDMQPVEVQEADAVELKDGRVMMFARTYSGFPVRAYSTDGCETWSKGEPIDELSMPYAGLPHRPADPVHRRSPLHLDQRAQCRQKRPQDPPPVRPYFSHLQRRGQDLPAPPPHRQRPRRRFRLPVRRVSRRQPRLNRLPRPRRPPRRPHRHRLVLRGVMSGA